MGSTAPVESRKHSQHRFSGGTWRDSHGMAQARRAILPFTGCEESQPTFADGFAGIKMLGQPSCPERGLV
jgi:hypothetical protein